jgi:NADP-dependent 3-hydroxy acid dehydrogenase YdfG
MSGSHDWYRGRVVIITGASTGIGRAVARQAVAAGANVALVARSSERLAELQTELGGPGRALTAAADVSQRDQINQAVESCATHFGRIDVAIANAGVEYLGPAERLDPAELQTMLDTNFFGLVHLAQAVVPKMRQAGSGTLAYVSSPMARVGFSWTAGYAASKAAAEAFLLGMSHELTGSGVHLIKVYPGPTDTTRPYLPVERIPQWSAHRPKEPVDQVAGRLLDAVASGGREKTLSRPVGTLFLLQRWVPGLADRLITRIGAVPAAQRI